MTNTEVRRYEVSNTGALCDDAGNEYTAQTVILASDHDAAIAALTLECQSLRDENFSLDKACKEFGAERDALKDQLQASQVAEQMASDDVRELKNEMERLREALSTILDNVREYDVDYSTYNIIDDDDLDKARAALSGKAP